MEMYLDDLIAYKSLYLLMQKKTSKNLEDELNDLRKSAEERCQKYAGYPMVQAKEKLEETSLAPITEEIAILRKIKNMIGNIRMAFRKNKQPKMEPEQTQQEAIIKLMLERYDKIIFAPKQIEAILGRETVMKVLGIDINEFVKENNKTKTRKISREGKAMPVMEH